MPHTPGKWLVARNGHAGRTYRIWRNDHAGELPNGRNEGYACIAPHVFGKDNADLVAAAPELLEALQLIDLAELSHGDNAMAFIRQTAREALANVKGAKP